MSVVLCFIASFIVTAFQGVENEAPVVFGPLPKTYRYVTPEKVVGKLSSESRSVQLAKLKSLQNSTLKKIQNIRGKAWVRFIKGQEKFGWVERVDFVYDPHNKRVQEKSYCLKKDLYMKHMEGEGVNINYRLDQFWFKGIHVCTPDYQIHGHGALDRSIMFLNLERPRWILSQTGFLYHRSLFYFDKTPDEFYAELKTFELEGRSTWSIKSNENYAELTELPSGSAKDEGRVWIFDLKKGGLCVHYRNQIIPAESRVVDFELTQVGKFWLPKSKRDQKISTLKNTILSKKQVDYFSMSVNGELSDEEFGFRKIPSVSDRFPVTDKRTSRRIVRTFGEMKELEIKKELTEKE